jgi:hypothetical protein
LEADDPNTTAPASPAMDTPPIAAPPSQAPSDLGTAPSSLPPDPTTPAAPVTTGLSGRKFVFIQDAHVKKWHGEHDAEGGIKRFTEYEVSDEDLDKWLTAHKFDDKMDLVKTALSGKRPLPPSIYHDFKKEVIAGSLGADKGSIDITFDSDKNFDNPSTTDLDVVFLKSVK